MKDLKPCETASVSPHFQVVITVLSCDKRNKRSATEPLITALSDFPSFQTGDPGRELRTRAR